MYVNPQTFRQWWDVFHSDNPLTEIRLLGRINGRDRVASGYFTDCETALAAVRNYPYEMACYAPINPVLSSCYGRIQHDVLIDDRGVKTTSGNDIEGRRWILLDFDPCRAADTNSTDEEKAVAYKTMKAVGIFLRDQGFKAPVVADSANGYHLMYRVNLANNEEVTKLISGFLSVLDMNFSTQEPGGCEIDTQVSDPNRISKIYGTKTTKGINIAERPQRESRFLKVPEEIEATDVAFIKKVAAMIPQTEQPNRSNGYNTSFDIEEFIRAHSIQISKRSNFREGEKLTLCNCPFDHNHKAPDSALFIMRSGAIGFKCLHNSCASYTWKDFRLRFDPEAYTRKDYAEYEKKRDFYSTQLRPAPVFVDEDEQKGRKWQNMKDIEYMDPSKLTYIPTGFTEVDKKMGGLCLGDVTIVSGISGSGKSTFINNIILSTIQHGYKASVWSGELAPWRFKSWLNQSAAGANMVKKSGTSDEYWYCPKDIGAKIDEWTKDKVYLYNNTYGNHSSQIISDIKECVKEKGTQLVILDNKMAMKLDSWDGDKNEKEAGLINDLRDFAIQANIHIILVCHPRKEQMNSLLRMESIAGNSDLYNCAANVLLVHRVGRDFERRAREFFRHDFVEDLLREGYNEVVEIAKNRSHGAKDAVVGLFYEQKTRRFLNNLAEYVIYGWQEGAVSPVLDMAANGSFGGTDGKGPWEDEDDLQEWEKN